jgi:hypothetical protein
LTGITFRTTSSSLAFFAGLLGLLLLLLLLLLLKAVANPVLCAAAFASVDTLAGPSPLVGGVAVTVLTSEGIVEWH